jgi:Family of unknown function (DUF6519)
MGSFSRNTFDATRNYIGVRMQQGVPLVDADWNEMDDAIRNEIYSGLNQVFPDGVEPGTQNFQISQAGAPANNLAMAGGAVLVGGRPLRFASTTTYTAQPWFNNPTKAQKDGIAVIPPLTTPTGNRTDLAFLDVWEREVRSTEDTNLVNPLIGVETCVRLKREFALRVAEGVQTLPAAPTGHSFVPLAFLNRLAAQANIITAQIDDIRPKLFSNRGTRSVSFTPALTAFASGAFGWTYDGPTHTAKCSTGFGTGLLPVTLPDGANLLSLRIQVVTQEFYIVFWRKPQSANADQILNVACINAAPPQTYDSVFPIPTAGRMNIVDNSRFTYFLWLQSGQQPSTLHRVFFNYQF